MTSAGVEPEAVSPNGKAVNGYAAEERLPVGQYVRILTDGAHGSRRGMVVGFKEGTARYQVVLESGEQVAVKSAALETLPAPTGEDAAADGTAVVINSDSALMFAVENQDVAVVRLLLEQKASPNAVVERGSTRWTALIKAVEHNRVDVVGELLAARALPNVVSGDFGSGSTNMHTPLGLACTRDYMECARALLEAKANVDQAKSPPKSPIHNAVTSGSNHCLQLLLASSASPDAAIPNPMVAANRSMGGRGRPPPLDAPPLSLHHFAAFHGNLYGVRLLVGARVDVSASRESLLLPLDRCANDEACVPCLRLILQEDAERNAWAEDEGALDAYGRLLCDACRKGNHRAVAVLIQCGVPPDRAVRAEGGGKETPLIAACRHRRVKVAEALIDAGANPSQQTPDGASAMRIAKENKDKELMALLIALLKRGQNLVGHRVRVSSGMSSELTNLEGEVESFDAGAGTCLVHLWVEELSVLQPHHIAVKFLRRLDEVLPGVRMPASPDGSGGGASSLVAHGAERAIEAGAGAASSHASAALLHSPGGGADGDGSPRPHEALSLLQGRSPREILLRACRSADHHMMVLALQHGASPDAIEGEASDDGGNGDGDGGSGAGVNGGGGGGGGASHDGAPVTGMSALHLAIAHRGVPLVRDLLAARADPNPPADGKGYSALMVACHVACEDSIHLLLEAKADPEARPCGATTALRVCLQTLSAERMPCAMILLENRLVNAHAEELLHSSILEGRADVVEVLLHKHVSPNGWEHAAELQAKRVDPPLVVAARKGQFECMRSLLRFGADALVKSELHENAVLAAARLGGNRQCITLAQDAAAHQQQQQQQAEEEEEHQQQQQQQQEQEEQEGRRRGRGGGGAEEERAARAAMEEDADAIQRELGGRLIDAARKGNTQELVALLAFGVDPNHSEMHGNDVHEWSALRGAFTSLDSAKFCDQDICLICLLAAKADPTRTLVDGWDLATAAAHSPGCATEIVEHICKPRQPGSARSAAGGIQGFAQHQAHPLIVAAHQANLKDVATMLADGTPIDQEYWDAEDSRAWTPLRAAYEADIKLSHTRHMCMLTLLAAKADPAVVLQPDGWCSGSASWARRAATARSPPCCASWTTSTTTRPSSPTSGCARLARPQGRRRARARGGAHRDLRLDPRRGRDHRQLAVAQARPDPAESDLDPRHRPHAAQRRAGPRRRTGFASTDAGGRGRGRGPPGGGARNTRVVRAALWARPLPRCRAHEDLRRARAPPRGRERRVRRQPRPLRAALRGGLRLGGPRR